MNERIDHAAEARRLQGRAREIMLAIKSDPALQPHMAAIILLDDARLEAQLAVAEQLRIGNEIALRQTTFNLHPSGTVQAINDEQTVERLWAALGVSNE